MRVRGRRHHGGQAIAIGDPGLGGPGCDGTACMRPLHGDAGGRRRPSHRRALALTAKQLPDAIASARGRRGGDGSRVRGDGWECRDGWRRRRLIDQSDARGSRCGVGERSRASGHHRRRWDCRAEQRRGMMSLLEGRRVQHDADHDGGEATCHEGWDRTRSDFAEEQRRHTWARRATGGSPLRRGLSRPARGEIGRAFESGLTQFFGPSAARPNWPMARLEPSAG